MATWLPKDMNVKSESQRHDHGATRKHPAPHSHDTAGHTFWLLCDIAVYKSKIHSEMRHNESAIK